MAYVRVGLLVLSLIVVLSACSSGSKTPEPKALTVTPLSGPPGTVLTVTGLQLTPEQSDGLELWVGDQPAPIIVNEDGSLSTAVPLFLGPSNWPQPPAEPQVVEVRRSGQVLGKSANGVAVTELPRAPGTTQEVQVALAQITSAYGELFFGMPAISEEQMLVREAVMAMLKELITDGENSLQAVLNGTAPTLAGAAVDTELIDAVLASSGAAAYLREYANAFQRTTTQAQLGTGILADLCDGEGADVELACMMQIYVVLDDYNQAFVKPTVETYANTVGLALGVLAISGVTIPVHVIISAILSVADFVYTKVVPALLPSKLSKFELQMSKSVIDLGEVTASKIMVTAVNNPPPLSLTEVMELTMTLIGLKDINKAQLAESFLEVLSNTAKFTLEFFTKLFPGTGNDVQAKIPPMQWGPVEVVDSRLVQLFSSDESIAAPLEEELEWKGTAVGETKVRVTPRGPGNKAKILKDRHLCFLCIYYGGAFGNDMPSVEKKVIVGEFFHATPDTGKAPLTTTFSWSGVEPQENPVTCLLDVGDGMTFYTIQDCANNRSQAHTYPYTSALQTESGKYQATLTVVGSEKTLTTEVLVDWTFTTTPTQGEAPLDVSFDWSGFDPGGSAISCTLDFGDGSAVQTFSNCHSTRTATHQYTKKGNYVPSLTVTGASSETVKTSQVSVGQQLCTPSTDTTERCVGQAQYTYSEWWYSGATTNEARDTWTFSDIEFVYDEVNSTATESAFYVVKATLVNYERWHKVRDQINGEICETYESASGISLVNTVNSIDYSHDDTPVGGWLIVFHEEAYGFPAGAYAGNASATFEASYTRTCTDTSGNISKRVTGGADIFLIPGPGDYRPGESFEAHVVQPGGVLSGTYSFESDQGTEGYGSGVFSWHFVIPDLY